MAIISENRGLAAMSVSGVSTTGGFVGRAHETEVLRSALSEALARRGRLLILAGEPGVGKTRLAEEIANFASLQGARVLWGRCWESGGAPAYWPWIQLIRASLHALPHEILMQGNSGLSHIAKLVPELHSSPAAPLVRDAGHGLHLAEPSMEPEERFQLFDAVSSLLRRIAANEPLMIIFDDLHAADEDSLLLLRFVARDSKQARILLVATYREIEARHSHQRSALIAEIGREGITVPLRGFSIAEVAEFIQRNTRLSADDATVASLYEATSGNPFFLDEMARLLTATHDPAYTRPSSGFAVPDSVREVIRRRIAPLAEQTRSVLAIASIIGGEFEIALLRMVSGVADDQLIEALGEAVANSLVTETTKTLGLYRFNHAITAEALRSELPGASRARLHERIATAIENLYADDLDAHLPRLAHHYMQAFPLGNADKAVEFARRGAQHAFGRLAFAEASRLYGIALRAITAGSRRDETARFELLLAMGEAQARCQSLDEARISFEQAAELARKLGQPDLLSRVALAASTWFSNFFAINTSLIAMLSEALLALGRNDTPQCAALMARLAGEYYWKGERERGRALCEEAVVIARRTGDRHALVSALWVQNEINWSPDNPEDRLAMATEIASLAESIGDHQRALRAHEMRFAALLETGDMQGLYAEVDAYAALAEKCGEQFGIVERFRAAIALLKGDFAEAERQTGQLTHYARKRQDPALLICANLLSESLAIERGQIDPAHIETSQKALIDRSPAMATLARAGLAFFYVAIGRRTEARAELEILAKDDFATIPRDWNWLSTICWLAVVCLDVGDVERVAILYDLLLPYPDRNVTIGWGDIAYGCSSRFLGMLAWKLRKLDDARVHFERALDFEERIGAKPWIAYTQVEYARMLLKESRASDRERALKLLNESLETASTLKMQLLQMRIQILMAKARTSATPRTVSSQAPGSSNSEEPVRRRRVIATLMFIDIVRSTERVAELSDRRWVEVHRQFFETMRNELSNFGGREIDTAGDGMLAVFEQPAAAIHSAFAMAQDARELALEIRAGIHTGECELVGDQVLGIAVHIGARVAAFAGANEVVVSNTVRELMAGGEIKFADRGVHILRGVPGEWHLYAVEKPE